MFIAFAHDFIAEMAMSKDDFDHLLFDNPISTTMEQSFGIPMAVETTLASGCPTLHLESPDSGFCEDQTVVSTDTEFESLPTSPSLSSTFFSNSPSSESGIEEDDEADTACKIEDIEISDALNSFSSNDEHTFSQLEEQMQAATTCPPVSSVADAYEELKQLLYTVATASQTTASPTSLIMSGMTTLPSVPTSMNTNFTCSMPVSTIAEYSKAQPVVANGHLTAVSNSNFGKIPSVYPTTVRTTSDLKGIRRKRRKRETPKLVIVDEPEEVIFTFASLAFLMFTTGT